MRKVSARLVLELDIHEKVSAESVLELEPGTLKFLAIS